MDTQKAQGPAASSLPSAAALPPPPDTPAWLPDSLCREAKAQFRAAGGTAAPPGVRNLLDLLNDYVRLKEAETARAALATANPLAARVLAALDEEAVLAAGQQQCAQGAAAQAAAAAAQQRGQAAAQAQGMSQPLGGGAPYVWQPQQGQQQAAAYTGGPAAEGGQAIGYAPRHGAPFVQPQHQAAAAAAGGCLPSQPQPATPGRHRKGAPRKRQRGADLPAGAGGAAAGPEAAPLPAVALFGGGGGDGAGWGSPLDLLNLPLDACGLELLLDDGPMQVGTPPVNAVRAFSGVTRQGVVCLSPQFFAPAAS